MGNEQVHDLHVRAFPNWTDYEGAPYVKAIYVGRADRRGSVEITREHGALFQMMRDLFNTDEWTERAYEALRLEAAE